MADSLGTVLASLLTGGALLLQAALNRRHDRIHHDEDVANARRKEEATARAEWAAAFQEAYTAAVHGIQWWKVLNRNKNNEVVTRALEFSDESRAARNRGQMATARLLVVDRDKVVRAVANVLMQSLDRQWPEDPKPNEIDDVAKHEAERLNGVYLGFLEFMELLAGTPRPDTWDKLARVATEVVGLPPEVKARILAAIDAKPVTPPGSAPPSSDRPPPAIAPG